MSDSVAYAYVCVGCGLVDEKVRRDQLTCSTACRVRAHRNGSLKELRGRAEIFELPPYLLTEISAILRLVPDLAEQIIRREIKLGDPEVRRRTHAAFVRLLLDAVRNDSPEALQEVAP